MTRLLAIAGALARSIVARAVITLVLLVVVFSSLDWHTITDKIGSGHPVDGLLAVGCVALALAVGAFRWDLLLGVAEVDLPRRELFRIYAVTSFANAFLPTSVGGDIARPLMVSRRGPVLVRAISTVLIERLSALVALVALAWVGAALEHRVVSGGALSALAVVSAGMVVVAVVLAARPSLVTRLVRAAVPARFSAHLGEGGAVFRALVRSPRAMLLVAVTSVAFQAFVTLQLVFLAKMIDVHLSFGLAAVALALVTLAILVPVSIGGFGVREGSYVVILAGGGIGHTDAVLISLLSVLALFLATLPGAYELVRAGFSPAITPDPGS
ncbi:MAG: lysylphosphatidylglycerol synthase transmembrane domain-containing protein [Solirubrobacteraceae bacterium]|nr:lysylphosphatidylglycerol synthase transmembrane domain-containing protein [Patulibacter sp.]